jgi:hyperosmotically inducible periplasmic protein
MQRTYAVALIVLVGLSLALGANAQTAQPPTTNQTVSNQQAGAAQSQAANENISPEVQAKLVQGVRHAILMLPYFGVFDNLAFQLQGRTVILQGQVVRATLKPDAERAVKKVEGVDKVVNTIEVLPPSPMDQQIREQVYRAIYSYGPLFKYANMPNPPIRIIVKNARVTLEGVVDTETDKNLCTTRVNQVSSVLSVTNNLRVIPPSGGKVKPS